MLGLNTIFHVFSLVLFIGSIYFFLRQSKKLNLIRDLWFADGKRLVVSPREFMQVFCFCYGLDDGQVKILTKKTSGNKKIFNARKYSKIFRPGSWNIGNNGLVFRMPSDQHIQALAKSEIAAFSDFLGLPIDIIEPD